MLLHWDFELQIFDSDLQKLLKMLSAILHWKLQELKEIYRNIYLFLTCIILVLLYTYVYTSNKRIRETSQAIKFRQI